MSLGEVPARAVPNTVTFALRSMPGSKLLLRSPAALIPLSPVDTGDPRAVLEDLHTGEAGEHVDARLFDERTEPARELGRRDDPVPWFDMIGGR